MSVTEWLLYRMPIPIWVVIVYLAFIGGLMVVIIILEWKYYGIKFDVEIEKRCSQRTSELK